MELISILFWILALVHFAPAIAAIAPSQLIRLYGISASNKSLIVLLQHRAVLFGIVGALQVFASVRPEVQVFALSVAAISMTTFILICKIHDQVKGPLRKIILTDVLALPVVVVLAALLMKS